MDIKINRSVLTQALVVLGILSGAGLASAADLVIASGQAGNCKSQYPHSVIIQNAIDGALSKVDMSEYLQVSEWKKDYFGVSHGGTCINFGVTVAASFIKKSELSESLFVTGYGFGQSLSPIDTPEEAASVKQAAFKDAHEDAKFFCNSEAEIVSGTIRGRYRGDHGYSVTGRFQCVR